MNDAFAQIGEPQDYFAGGVGQNTLPVPRTLLLFTRTSKTKLQQESLKSRSHHRFVLIFNMQTPGQVHLDNHQLSFRPDQALLIHPYQFHHFSQLASKKLKWLFCTFELTPESFLRPLRNRVVGTSGRTERMFRELMEQWNAGHSELQTAMLQATLLRLLLSLKTDHQEGADEPPEAENHGLLQQINRILSEQKGHSATIGDIARSLGMSESRLHARFKETAGIALGGYILNYRINRAMELLHNTDFSLSDIAEEAGFGSPQAFSRSFKKQTGQTPRDYRNRKPMSR